LKDAKFNNESNIEFWQLLELVFLWTFFISWIMPLIVLTQTNLDDGWHNAIVGL
jgi:hypothetical protein